MEKRERLHVSLLGGFKICRADGPCLTEADNTSKRLLAFLEYLSVFHQRPVSQEELIDALWGDVDSSDPANTLKTLLHRARNALEAQLGFPAGKDVILYKRSLYTWNPEIELILDTERFDEACSRPVGEDVDGALLSLGRYGGDFLPGAAGSPWTVSLRTYYHARYMTRCADLAQHLIALGRGEDAERICRGACTLDPYDERCHMLLMQAMVAKGARQSAIAHYTQVNNMLMDQLGVTPSGELTRFYRELTRAEMGVEMDLQVVRDQLLGESDQGAFFCEYVTFQDIYRLRVREALRSGQVVQLVMVTVLNQEGRPLDPPRCAAAQEALYGAIRSCLRSVDTFTRFSPSQYLILLPTASYEDGVKILRRVLAAYSRSLIGLTTAVRSSLLPMLPTQQNQGPVGFVPTGK